jgi:hypothetical protein
LNAHSLSSPQSCGGQKSGEVDDLFMGRGPHLMVPTDVHSSTHGLHTATGPSLACAADRSLRTPQINLVELLGSDSLVYGHLGTEKRGVRLSARLHAASAQAQV